MRLLTSLLLAGLLAVPSTARAQEAPEAKTALEEALGAWEVAFNSGDAAALTAVYAKDAVVMPPGTDAVTGHEALMAMWTKEIATGAKFSIEPGDVMMHGDMAVETGTYTANSAEGEHLDHGKYMAVWKNVPDVGWKIVRDIWNSSM